jgi:peptide/nickel transport system substrate-binding protein
VQRDYDALQGPVLTLTNDSLVGFRQVGGNSGSELVADLAISLPHPTAGGTTYTFRLRPGIRYSSGQVVRPEDVRSSIERSFKLRSAYTREYLREIVGAEACVRRPVTCQLTEGIATDASANAITFRLTRPNPDFLADLAGPGAFVVPAATPAKDVGTSPAPATGPYMIQSFAPKRAVAGP